MMTATDGQAAHHQIQIPDDGSEKIVEIVGNPPGQLSDRIHLSRLPKPRFQRPLLGHVPANAENPDDLAESILHRR